MSSLKKLYYFLSKNHQSIHLDYPISLQPRYGHGKPAHEKLLQIIGSHRIQYSDLINELLSYQHIYGQWPAAQELGNKGGVIPAYNNAFLPALDMMGIYTMLAKYKPKTYLEIGSGNSTKVARACINDQKQNTLIISVDPAPRAEIDSISDEIHREAFEKSGTELTRLLGPNDILFIDNSHRILSNSDAMVFFMEVLHELPKGLIVHLHDIYLPYDYPQFMCDRGYNEQYGLAFYLLANPKKYMPLLPMYYISQDEELKSMLNPLWQIPVLKNVEQHGGSFWMQIQ